MKRIPIILLLLLAAVSTAGAQTRRVRKPAAAQAPTPTAIVEHTSWPLETLTVEGAHNYSTEQILAVAGLHLGQHADKAEFEAARERLMATGAFEMVGYRFAPAKDEKREAALAQSPIRTGVGSLGPPVFPAVVTGPAFATWSTARR